MGKIATGQILPHLRAKWAGRACPMCGIGSWNVQDSVFQLMEFNEGNVVIGGPVVPVVPVVCANCGNTVLVNAIISGLIKPPVEGKP